MRLGCFEAISGDFEIPNKLAISYYLFWGGLKFLMKSSHVQCYIANLLIVIGCSP